MITGTARTDVQGSDAEFDICEPKEWEGMGDDEKHQTMISALWESGVLDVWVNE